MTSAQPIELIVGLGNPGPQYEITRHNVGVWFVEKLAEQYSARFLVENKFAGRIARISLANHDCWLLIPNTYMNESGRPLKAVTQFYKIPPTSVLVVHDDLDFDPGIIRFKHSGGHGGHNGLRDIINHLHNKDFHRLRIGIGHPGNRSEVVNYVLTKPSMQDHEKITAAIDEGLAVIDDYAGGNMQRAIHTLHNIDTK